MDKEINKNFKAVDYWSDAWVRHIETYLMAIPRTGIWLHNYLKYSSKTILECAGGSCRDSRYLYNIGYEAVGSDFDEKTLNYVNTKYSNSNFSLQKKDGFNLDCKNNQFAVVFHNGFWVLFNDDNILVKLLKEQARVTKNYLVILVHNSMNKSQIKTYEEKSKKDDLYKIRMFNKEELISLLNKSNIKYSFCKFYKFGGFVDLLYEIPKKYKFTSKLMFWLVPKLYKLLPWAKVERIVMVIKL